MKVYNKYVVLVIAYLALFQTPTVKCEETGLTDTLSALSYIISWLPKASIPTAPLRLISLMLNVLVKQLQTTLTVLDEKGGPVK